jgi:hypothetical protein
MNHMGIYEWNEKGEGEEDIIKLKNGVCYHIDPNNYHCHHTYNNITNKTLNNTPFPNQNEFTCNK